MAQLLRSGLVGCRRVGRRAAVEINSQFYLLEIEASTDPNIILIDTSTNLLCAES